MLHELRWRRGLALLALAALALIAGGCKPDRTPTPIEGTSTPAPTPTATPTPEPTPVAPTTTVLEDDLDDGVNCVTGQPLTETPPGIDIARAVVDILLGETSGEPEHVRVTIELDQAPALDAAIFGGFEFADTSRAISPLNPQWYYDGIGNQNFSFGIRGQNVVPKLHQFDPVSGWTTNANTGFWVEIDGNRIFIFVPVSEIPANSPFYVAVTDSSACDAVGLDDDRQPTGQVPWGLTPGPTPTSP